MKGNAYKWWLLALLFVTFFLELGSRQLYNAALPQIKVDFAHLGITDTQLGVVGTVFSAVFGLCLVASGLAADLLGRKRVIVLGTALFSLAICASGFAGGIVALIVAYGVFNAMGQCCIAPPSYSLISQHHVETRATAMGIFQSAVYLGVVLGSVFAGVLAESGVGGWRIAFWLFGGVGVAWALVMAFTLRETPVAATDGEKVFAACPLADSGIYTGEHASGVKVAIEVTGVGAGLNSVLDVMAPMGRVALLGCTRNSDFSIDYYHKVHGRGVALFGAHTWARPLAESSPGLFTHRDDAKTFLRLLSLGRVTVDGFVAEVRSPAECGEVYARLAKGGAFPTTQFDWTKM